MSLKNHGKKCVVGISLRVVSWAGVDLKKYSQYAPWLVHSCVKDSNPLLFLKPSKVTGRIHFWEVLVGKFTLCCGKILGVQ